MTKEALTLALDKKADNARELGLDYEPENTLHWHALNYRTAPTQNADKMFKALEKFVENSIKETLAQPEQEPVAWMSEHRFDELRKGFTVMTTLTKQRAFEDDVAIYTTPPQRKPLTDEQINEIANEYLVDYRIPAGCAWNFARDIEAAHGIKE